MPSDHFETTEERKSVLWRVRGYRDNTPKGHRTGGWQSHHIVCNHAIEGRDDQIKEDSRPYVEACLWVTDWDLNNPDNLIGLPTNWHYRMSDGTDPVNYCSHQVDHNTTGGYTDECKSWLRINVWDKLHEKRKQHDVKAESLKAQLEQGTSVFLDKLQRRGLRKGGTATCWAQRFNPPYTDYWYFPFSMGMFPRPRSPGLPIKGLEKILALIS